MANPQLEDGYTPIANEILEALMRSYLSPNQWQVLLCIIRKTYGFRKKIDYITNRQIVEATGLGKTTVSRALTKLKQQGLITRNGKHIGFLKDYELWKVSRTANTHEQIKAKVSRTANTHEQIKAKVSRTANTKKLAERGDQKLAEQLTELAEQLTKVSSPVVTQNKKETIQKKIDKKNKNTDFNNFIGRKYGHLLQGKGDE